MHKLNKYSAPTHWSKIQKINPSKSRCKNKYVTSMNPGKPKDTSLPLRYLIKSIDNVNFKSYFKKVAAKKADCKILINEKAVTQDKYPVGLLDYVELRGFNVEYDAKVFQLYFEKNTQRNIKVYPTLKEVSSQMRVYPVKNWYLSKKNKISAQSFQGSIFNFDFNEQSIKDLKTPGCFILKNKENTVKKFSFTVQLIKGN